MFLNTGVMCDPSQGPCCGANCGFKGSAVMCKPVGECTYEQVCDGTAARCPDPDHKPENTPCNGLTQICKQGVS